MNLRLLRTGTVPPQARPAVTGQLPPNPIPLARLMRLMRDIRPAPYTPPDTDVHALRRLADLTAAGASPLDAARALVNELENR